MKKISSFLLLLLLFVLSGCLNMRHLEKELEGSREFDDILALKYIRYSYILRKNYDYSSASYFLKLGKQAYKRKKNFELNYDYTGLKELDPDALANLYFSFNCWLYYETNHKNLGEATICKETFLKETSALEKRKNLSIKAKTVKLEEEKARFLTKEEELFYLEFAKNQAIDIYFDFDNYKLNEEALVKISSVLKYINELKNDYKITVVGHADRRGKVIYNNTLARRRANTVYNILLKNGVPRTLITMESYSSKDPQVLTRVNEKNQLNRRVEIIISTNFKEQDLTPQPMKLQVYED